MSKIIQSNPNQVPQLQRESATKITFGDEESLPGTQSLSLRSGGEGISDFIDPTDLAIKPDGMRVRIRTMDRTCTTRFYAHKCCSQSFRCSAVYMTLPVPQPSHPYIVRDLLTLFSLSGHGVHKLAYLSLSASPRAETT